MTGQAKHHIPTRRARKRAGKLHTERVNEVLECSPEHIKAKKVAGNHLHTFTKGKSHLTNMVSGSAGKGRAADVVERNHGTASNQVSHNILPAKSESYGLTGEL